MATQNDPAVRNLPGRFLVGTLNELMSESRRHNCQPALRSLIGRASVIADELAARYDSQEDTDNRRVTY